MIKNLFKNNTLFCFLFAITCAFFSVYSHAASYQFAGPTTPYTWVDISATGTAVTLGDDTVSAAVPIGFTFNYGGLNYTQAYIASNGMLFFNATAPTGNWWVNSTVTTSQTNYSISNALMPYWDDLDPSATSVPAATIRYQTQGTTPNRQFIVSFIRVQTFGSLTSPNTFQVILNENGTILYNYQATANQAASATIGYQVNTADFVQFSFNTASVPNLRTLTLTRIPPSLINLKTVTLVSDPSNNVTNPKNIPGAVESYNITINNASQGVVDTGTISITDAIPTNTELFTGGLSATAPFTFTDGAPASGLSCVFTALNSATDCIEFSNNNGTSWVYVPINTSDYDPAVTNIRLRPTGVMSGDTTPVASPYPNFVINFKVRIK